MAEKKMTVDCGDCGFTFGAWRPNCPTCGWKVPSELREKMLNPPRLVTHEPRPKREKEKREDECVLCRRRVKPDVSPMPITHAERMKALPRCPHCDEPCHERCLKYHRGPCLQFVMEVEALAKKQPIDVHTSKRR